jgi:hypothetical protein
MAQSGFTPISLYYSSTVSQVPLAANLAFGELAINILDGKLYYKNSVGAVTLLASSAIAGGAFTTLSYSTSFTGVGAATITDNSTSAALRITQTGTGNSIVVEDSPNPDSTPFVVDTNGLVIIGSTANIPIYSINPSLEVLGTGNAYQMNASFRNDTFSNILTLAHSRNTTIGSHTIVANGDELGSTAFAGSDGTAFIRGAQITAYVDGTPTTNSMPSRVSFFTNAPSGTSLVERMRIDSSGNVGVGNAVTTLNQSFTVGKPITGGVACYGVASLGQVQTDVTSGMAYYIAFSGTSAGFALPVLRYYYASQGTFGGTVTNQNGFVAESNLVGGTNNWGFVGAIPFGTNRFNLYMNGTADNFLNGSLGIGSGPGAGTNFIISKPLTGAASSFAISVNGVIQSDVTTAAYGAATTLSTAAAAFTLTNLYHHPATQGTIGNGSIVTTQQGFLANSNITGATNNYGFYGGLPKPTVGTFFGSTALNVSQTGTTVTVTTTAPHNLVNGQVVTVALTANATALVSGVTCTILTLGTTDFTLIGAASNTVGVSFTVNAVTPLGTGTVTLNSQGSGKVVAGAGTVGVSTTFTYTATSATFAAVTVLTGAITIALNYNIYCPGSADNYMSGSLGIGSTSSGLTDTSIKVAKQFTGSLLYGIYQIGVVQSDITSNVQGFRNLLQTQAASFTLNSYYHYSALQAALGAGSSVSNQWGFLADPSMISATTNVGFYAGDTSAVTAGKTAYGFYSAVNTASGGGTTWGFYSAGTANNYMAGKLWLGSTAPGTVNLANYLDLTGAVNAFGTATASTIRSSVTSSATMFYSVAATEAVAFTLTSLTHYAAAQSTFANTAVTTQTGFHAQSTLIGAANTYGFYGSIPAGTNRYNLYLAGSANNYMAGSLGIGNLPSAGQTLYLAQSITGNANSTAVRQQGPVDMASVTSSCYAFDNVAILSASGSLTTLPTYVHYNAQQGPFGTNSIVTTQAGFTATPSLIGATNNYGFYAGDTSAVVATKTTYGFYSIVNTATGGGTAYGFYAAGTAPNVFNNVNVLTKLGYTTGGGGAVTQTISRATAVTLDKCAGQITMFTAAGSATWATFQVNNALVTANDTVLLSVTGATNAYVMFVSSISAGAFIILFSSVSGTASDTPKINFTVVKGAIA